MGLLKYELNEKGGPGSSSRLAVSTTYLELKALRDGGNLVPGTWYRITDYVCTTTQAGTESVRHNFDIIVRADDASHLNENAFAAHHAGDLYFADCKLEAWELKYCLDNDTSRFAWANTANGRGVVFYMKDEWNNECPYDFKNILFERSKITACPDSPSLVGSYAKEGAQGITVDPDQTKMVYTFCMIDLRDQTIHDVSVEQDIYQSDEGYCYKTTDNHISTALENVQDEATGAFVMILPDIVFVTDTMICSIEEDYGEFFGFRYNRFKNNCTGNTFGNQCINNTFGNYFCSNTFGAGCNSNTFGGYGADNTLGNYCHYNIFGNYFRNNSFGGNCVSNTFGNNCESNTFGVGCQKNTFGNTCCGNTFGEYFQKNTVFDNVKYCNVADGTTRNPVQNGQILNGTSGSANRMLTIGFDPNIEFPQVAALGKDGVRVFIPGNQG